MNEQREHLKRELNVVAAILDFKLKFVIFKNNKRKKKFLPKK